MKRLALFASGLLLMTCFTAQAQDAYVTANLNMRAAPDVNYPLITTIPQGTPVSVQGCIDDYLWCDVIAYGNRGWVAGDYLDYTYQDRRVSVAHYGAQIGIPIISFIIGDYWGRHYSHRSFYRNRNNWYHRPIHYRRHVTSHRPGHRPSHHNGNRPGHRPQPRVINRSHHTTLRTPVRHGGNSRSTHTSHARPVQAGHRARTTTSRTVTRSSAHRHAGKTVKKTTRKTVHGSGKDDRKHKDHRH